jgi:hypothetical protein
VDKEWYLHFPIAPLGGCALKLFPKLKLMIYFHGDECMGKWKVGSDLCKEETLTGLGCDAQIRRYRVDLI